MKLPSFRRLYHTDFVKEYQNLILKLSQTLNINLESLYTALNNNITLTDNVKADVREFNVRVNADGVPLSATSVALSTTEKVQQVLVGNVINMASVTNYVSGGVTISWSQNEKSLSINHITGLYPNQTYFIRITAFY